MGWNIVVGQVGGFSKSVSAEFTRPANTTAYAINDVLGTDSGSFLTLSSAGRLKSDDEASVSGTNPASGLITKVLLTKDGTTVTNATFRVLFFRSALTSDPNDNTELNVPWSERAKLIGAVDLDTMVSSGAGIPYAQKDTQISFDCDSAEQDMFAIVQALAAYTPASAENFRLEIGVEQN